MNKKGKCNEADGIFPAASNGDMYQYKDFYITVYYD